MRSYIILFFLLLSVGLSAQSKKSKTDAIVAEGMRLYHSEKASWHGTDILRSQFKEFDRIGGYFSYTQNAQHHCVFFSTADIPQVLATISFDDDFDLEKAQYDATERNFSDLEQELFLIREMAIIEASRDTMFKRFENTRLNFIPLLSEGERKVYVLTGPEVAGVVVFGNDYLLRFDKKYKLVEKKALHANIITVPYGSKDKKVVTSIHSHTKKTGHYITPTDICTLMLYAPYTTWESHVVTSKKFYNTWDCQKHTLSVIPMKTIEKINETQQKMEK